MQPHTAAIILAVHNHLFYSIDERTYNVRARSTNRGTKGPGELRYRLTFTTDDPKRYVINVEGDINYATFQRCDATVEPIDDRGTRFRVTHNHSHLTTEEWSVDKKEIFRGEYKSGDSKRRSSFSAHLHGEKSATFRESGGYYETWEVQIP